MYVWWEIDNHVFMREWSFLGLSNFLLLREIELCIAEFITGNFAALVPRMFVCSITQPGPAGLTFLYLVSQCSDRKADALTYQIDGTPQPVQFLRSDRSIGKMAHPFCVSYHPSDCHRGYVSKRRDSAEELEVPTPMICPCSFLLALASIHRRW